MSYLKSMEKAKAFNESAPKTTEVVTIDGVDVLIISPTIGNASEPWNVVLKKSQLKSTQAKTFLAFLKGLKIPGTATGWSHTFDGKGKWHQIDNLGNVRACLPSSNAWLPAYVLMPSCGCACLCSRAAQRLEAGRVPLRPGRGRDVRLGRGEQVVKSLTFKDALDGTNISKAQAVDNSENWELTQPDHDPAEALDMLPASNDDFAADMVASQSEAASSPGSSASHAATPAKRTRRG